jgi:membrane protein YdbS with pleckstrin-like domain
MRYRRERMNAPTRPSRALDRRVLWLWWTVLGLWALAGMSGVFVLVANAALPTIVGYTVSAVGIAGALLVPPFRYRRWRYQIRRRDLLVARGALFYRLTLVPFDRIQFVETRQGPLDRMFGLNQLLVYTAAGRAGQVPGLAPREAESLREELSRVAGAPSV